MAELKEIYKLSWQAMQQTRNICLVLREIHYPALAQWLAPLYPKAFLKQLRYQGEVGHIVNEEYSAEFQIDLFDLNISRIKQPVLDIGCGSRANLVRYLRSLGVEAFGIDRYLKIHEPYLDQIDWFEYTFCKGSWGTIVSNMAFTNHLNFAYLHDFSQFEPYLLKMNEILESLQGSGSYYYAPALPFIEDRLVAHSYRVDRQPVTGDIFFSTIIKIG